MNLIKRFFRIRNQRLQAEERSALETLERLGINRESEAGIRRFATVLSFLVPGLGQIYRGYIPLGFVWLVVVAGGYFYVPWVALLFHVVCVSQAYSLKVDKDVADLIAASA